MSDPARLTSSDRDALLHWCLAFLAAGLAVAFTQVGEGHAAYSPNLAVGVLMVLSCGRRSLAPALVLEAVVSALAHHGDLSGALVGSAATTLELAIVAALLHRLHFRRDLPTLQDLARLVTAAVVGALLAATVGTLVTDAVTSDTLAGWELFQVWFVGDLAGVVLLLPAVAVLARPVRALASLVHLRRGVHRTEYTVAMAAAVAGAVAVFHEAGAGQMHGTQTALLLVSFLPVMWIGARFGTARTALGVLVLDVAAVVSYQGLGPHLFGSAAARPSDLVPVKIATLVVAIAAFGVAIAVESERLAGERERAILRANPAAIAALDRTGLVTVWSGAAERMFGFTEDEVIGRIPPTIPADGLADYHARIQAELVGPFERRVEYVRKDGSRLIGRLTATPLRDADGEVTGILQLVDDLTGLVAGEERQQLLASEIDQLQSDLAQQQADSAAIAEVVRRLRRENSTADAAVTLWQSVLGIPGISAALVMAVHRDGALVPIAMGDPGLRTMAIGQRLEGGWTETLRNNTERGPWVTDWTRAPAFVGDVAAEMHELGITASAHVPIQSEGRMIGILVLSTQDPDGARRMRARLPMFGELAALSALVLSLSAGAGGWNEATRGELLEVIAHERFHPVYQPVVELATGRVVGYEALTRFVDGTPDQRFGAAVEVGLSAELEAACAAAALRDAKDLPPDVWLSINLSPQLVQDRRAHELIAGWGRPLVIEVTEHVVIDDYTALRAALAQLPHTRVSVDDAGAGYASLRHILELEPQIVKLDVGLVRGIHHDRARQALVAGLVHYAKTAGIDLIAEGVETEDEAQTLRILGVGWGQGYLLGRPLPLP